MQTYLTVGQSGAEFTVLKEVEFEGKPAYEGLLHSSDRGYVPAIFLFRELFVHTAEVTTFPDDGVDL